MPAEFSGNETFGAEKFLGNKEQKALPPFEKQVERMLAEKMDFLRGIQLTPGQFEELSKVTISEESCDPLAEKIGLDTAVVAALKTLLDRGELPAPTLH
jgi:hypothetical protein